MMQLRAAQHEIRARLANLRAVDHQSKVLWLGVFAAGFEAMIHRRLQAVVVTFEAVLDALFQRRVRVGVRHGVLLFSALRSHR